MEIRAEHDMASRATLIRGRLSDKDVLNSVNTREFVGLVYGAIADRLAEKLIERFWPAMQKALAEEFGKAATKEAPSDDAP